MGIGAGQEQRQEIAEATEGALEEDSFVKCGEGGGPSLPHVYMHALALLLLLQTHRVV